jgi:hypothetical protein
MRRAVPLWALLTIAGFALLTLGYFGWHAIAGYPADPGPPMKVRPGMYDLRAEAQKMRAAQEQKRSSDAP